MSTQHVQKLAPFFWMAAGALFLISAAIGKQAVFAGIGVMFIMLGVVFYVQARKAKKS